jgi:hypothetical protein
MSTDSLEEIIKRAEALAPDEQLLLIAHLAEKARQAYSAPTSSAEKAGAFRQRFGSWDSGNARSADNKKIDEDLAREHASAHEAIE